MKFVLPFAFAGVLFLSGCGDSGDTPKDGVAKCPEKDLNVCLPRALEKVAGHFRKQDTMKDLVMQLALVKGHGKDDEFTYVSGSVNNRDATVEDTFLFGSGTKPITATSVMRLIDNGDLKEDTNLCELVNPYLTSQNQTTLDDLYGSDICTATVLQVIQMQAGIKDFEDDYSFDQESLHNGTYQDYPYDSMHFASKLSKGSLTCKPGECACYSSTSYEVAGLILMAAKYQNQSWYELDLGELAVPEKSRASRYPSLKFPPVGETDAVNGSIKDYLTVPGVSVSKNWDNTLIWNQSASILGWTCGSMVGTVRDVARFYFDLLGPGNSLVTADRRKHMIDFQPLNKGWIPDGGLNYSSGFEEKDYSLGKKTLHGTDHFSYGWGHGGVTYGFQAEQGFIPRANASFSIASNTDNKPPKEMLACLVTSIMSEVFADKVVNYECGDDKVESVALA